MAKKFNIRNCRLKVLLLREKMHLAKKRLNDKRNNKEESLSSNKKTLKFASLKFSPSMLITFYLKNQ